ncbi:MAG TPA: ABC transporter ATP-binding protein [Clostridiales bacterium]|nr:ABC transporter ATP-binding protein [Clostridiales bacterium]HQP69182.1 ABC transporter ATP-binding protein [Clostridiales bacterium]
MFRLENAQISFSGFSLNSGLLEFEKGRIYCLTGPNGSGKSTLLKIIGLQLQPDSGSVSIEGRAVDYGKSEELLKNRRNISYMLQDSRLFYASVFDNAAYGLKIRGLGAAEIKEKVNKILKMLEIGHLASRSLKGLSGGEAQRVRLARNLVIDAPVYILDEPSAGLDTRGRELLAEILSSYNKEKGATIIFTSHHKEEAYRLSPEIISVIDGKVSPIPRENVFTGSAEKTGEKLYRFRNENISSIYFSSDHAIKDKVSIAIDPEEVILSLTNVHTSARNCLPGTVKNIKEIPSALQLTVTAGEDFTVLITKNSLEEMSLKENSPVYMLFKATAVKVIN